MHPNEQLIRTYINAWQQNDLDTIRKIWAEDVVIHQQPRTTHGQQEFWDFHREVIEEKGVDWGIVEVRDALASDDHAVLLVQERAERPGKTPLDINVMAVYRIESGKVVEIWVHHDDPAAVVEFYS